MYRLSPLAFVLAACCTGSDKDSGDAVLPTAECTDLTWENFGYGFVHTWCSACHSSNVEGYWRQCSPEGLNFDTLPEVQAWATQMDRKVWGDVAGAPPITWTDTGCPDHDDTGGCPERTVPEGECTGVPMVTIDPSDQDCTCVGQSDMQMPPAGGMTQPERDLFHEWLSCGAPGVATEPALCDVDVPSSGAVTVASAADADALCGAGTNHVAGDLEISAAGAVALDCLCAVDGTLTVTSGPTDVSLANLGTAGALVVDGATTLASFSAPELTDLTTGDLLFRGDDALASLGLPLVTTIAGSVTFQDLPALLELPIGYVSVVGGDFSVVDIAATRIDVLRVHTVGGSVIISDNPFLLEIDDPYGPQGSLESLQTVGGAITVSGNPVLENLYVAKNVVAITGPVTVSDNASIANFDGFDVFGEYHPDDTSATPPWQIPISIVVTGNASLQEIEAFNTLQSADAITISDNPELGMIGDQAFANLLFTSGAVAITGNDKLGYLTGLGRLDSCGDLTVSDNGLGAIANFDLLTAVHGTLTVAGNPAMTQITGLELLAAVDGDFVLDANPVLDTILGLGSLEQVGGSFVVTDNPSLPTDRAQDLLLQVDAEDVGGSVVISGNAP